MHKCRKVGEGVYGEVFATERRKQPIALKVIKCIWYYLLIVYIFIAVTLFVVAVRYVFSFSSLVHLDELLAN